MFNFVKVRAKNKIWNALPISLVPGMKARLVLRAELSHWVARHEKYTTANFAVVTFMAVIIDHFQNVTFSSVFIFAYIYICSTINLNISVVKLIFYISLNLKGHFEGRFYTNNFSSFFAAIYVCNNFNSISTTSWT